MTRIEIHNPDLQLPCPACGAHIREIQASNDWEMTIQCEECLEESTLELTLSR